MQPVTLTLVRDSVLFYFPMFGMLASSVPVVAIYRSTLANIPVPIYVALYSFCVSSFLHL
ncbi:hypothetical protein EDD16DRAFT_1568478 [Pisolithus croceorrhizus]|nr:hypothetical protein EDD16DRAFT_1568478 [Pisolithus croceorrhizus]